MPYGTYSGGWLRNSYTDPDQAVTHTADPAHAGEGTRTLADDPGAYADQAPQMQEVSPYVGQYPGSEWVVSTPPTVFVHDPAGHAGDAGPATNDGAARRGYTGIDAPMRFNGEADHVQRFAGLQGVSNTVSNTSLRRGLNDDPVNNPEGFNPGSVEQWWSTRRFNIGRRVHETRVVQLNTPDVEADTPPVPTPTGTPFSSLSRPMKRNFQRPALRRSPPPMSQDQLVEPVQYDANAAYPTWVVV